MSSARAKKTQTIAECVSRLGELKRLHNEAATLVNRVFRQSEDMPPCFEHMDSFTDSIEEILFERIWEAVRS